MVDKQPRELVARTNRMLYMEGLVSYSGHVSMRDPDDENIVYINSHSAPRGEVEPEDIVKITLDSEQVNPDAPRPVSEAEIHTSVYRERDDINSVLHIHPPIATLFGITGTDLQPVHIRGSILVKGPVPTYDRPGLIRSKEASKGMVESMEDHNQLLIRNHGAVVADESIMYAFVRAICLEMNARFQKEASDIGNPNPLSTEEVKQINEQNWNDRVVEKLWSFYKWKAQNNGFDIK